MALFDILQLHFLICSICWSLFILQFSNCWLVLNSPNPGSETFQLFLPALFYAILRYIGFIVYWPLRCCFKILFSIHRFWFSLPLSFSVANYPTFSFCWVYRWQWYLAMYVLLCLLSVFFKSFCYWMLAHHSVSFTLIWKSFKTIEV